MSGVLTLGIDVGGTKAAAGVVDARGQIVVRREVPSPADSAEALVEAIVALVRASTAEVAGDHSVAGVGLCVAGFVDVVTGTVVTAPNLAWRDLPLREVIAERTGLPVVVENDANAAAWGEHVHGAGRGVSEMLLVSVGTGIGGGIITGGELRRGGHGMAAEVGHLTFVADGEPCGCGRRGCWEQYASGRALGRLSGTPSTGREILALAQRGDAEAMAAFVALGTHLGRGIASLVAVLDPSVVVIGGGVAAAGDLLLGPARAALLADLPGGPGRPAPEIVAAALGNDAGIIGAAHLAAATREKA